MCISFMLEIGCVEFESVLRVLKLKCVEFVLGGVERM